MFGYSHEDLNKTCGLSCLLARRFGVGAAGTSPPALKRYACVHVRTSRRETWPPNPSCSPIPASLDDFLNDGLLVLQKGFGACKRSASHFECAGLGSSRETRYTGFNRGRSLEKPRSGMQRKERREGGRC